ncbi:HdeD family acid-resistance protein [Leifsonia sp. A12D58]|uniref:HdeD family acid-resistance protein n=1 Tax=Leifsonia sp. A12D58 TaxID=3397674 RepID=UPI0039E17395
MSNDFAVFDFRVDPNELTKSAVSGVRTAIAISGVIALVLGVMILVWQDATVSLIAILFGLYFLIAGIIRLVRGIFVVGVAPGPRVLNIMLGVLLIIAGIISIRNPLNSLVVLGMVIGISWIIEGVAALVETSTDSSRWFGILFGVVSIIAGIVVLLSPVESIGVLVLIGGIFLVITGILQLIQAFTFGRAAKAVLGS